MERLQNKLNLIAEQLAEYQKRKHLSQRQLAEILGKEVGYVNNVLQGKANLTLRTVADFEERLGVTLLEKPDKRWVLKKENPNSAENKTGLNDRSSLFNFALN